MTRPFYHAINDCWNAFFDNPVECLFGALLIGFFMTPKVGGTARALSFIFG